MLLLEGPRTEHWVKCWLEDYGVLTPADYEEVRIAQYYCDHVDPDPVCPLLEGPRTPDLVRLWLETRGEVTPFWQAELARIASIPTDILYAAVTHSLRE